MEKSCENCGFYAQYYYILHARLRRADCGHCNSFNSNGHRRKTGDICPAWKERITENPFVIERLKEVSAKIDDIYFILQK